MWQQSHVFSGHGKEKQLLLKGLKPDHSPFFCPGPALTLTSLSVGTGHPSFSMLTVVKSAAHYFYRLDSSPGERVCERLIPAPSPRLKPPKPSVLLKPPSASSSLPRGLSFPTSWKLFNPCAHNRPPSTIHPLVLARCQMLSIFGPRSLWVCIIVQTMISILAASLTREIAKAVKRPHIGQSPSAVTGNHHCKDDRGLPALSEKRQRMPTSPKSPEPNNHAAARKGSAPYGGPSLCPGDRCCIPLR
jgi:hypothetical protein